MIACLIFNYCSYLLQRDCNDLITLFTMDDMSKYHNIIQTLISEVTFRKVESMLQVREGDFKISNDFESGATHK